MDLSDGILREIVLKYFNNEDEDTRLKLPQKIWDKVKEILVRENYSMTMNGAVFDRSKDGLLPQLITRIYNNRKATKKEMQNVERFIVALDAAHKGNRDIDLDYKSWTKEALEGISEDSYNKLKTFNEALQDQLHIKQLALKILINALYGAQATPASTITRMGVRLYLMRRTSVDLPLHRWHFYQRQQW